jgi:cytochrome c oxidase cbb3-type subunit 3
MRHARTISVLAGAALAVVLAAAGGSCKREERTFRVQPPQADPTYSVQLSEIFPGTQPALVPGTTRPTTAPVHNDYEQNAYALSEGKRLFAAYNCNGCHANGGGGMGPPLIDREWWYGYRPEQVYATIIQGRPNGMPAFGGKIPDHQVWQLAAYVRSMSGLVPSDAAPGRNDDLQSKPPEHSIDTGGPVNSTYPR